MRASATVPVLTYHSIARGEGPTAMPEDVFAMQLDVLADEGFRTVSCGDLAAWLGGAVPPRWPARPVLITFDDAFADFATCAHPALAQRGFGALVFVPTGWVGAREGWPGAHRPARPLMDWATLRALATAGVELGAHGVRHADLTRLAPDLRRAEIEGSAQALAAALGVRPRAFAAPYGRVDAATRADIRASFEIAFGTRFAPVRRSAPADDVPRVEMHYFRNAARWRAFLKGSVAYYSARRTLRALRDAGSRLVGGAG